MYYFGEPWSGPAHWHCFCSDIVWRDGTRDNQKTVTATPLYPPNRRVVCEKGQGGMLQPG